MIFNDTAVERFWNLVQKTKTCWLWRRCRGGRPTFSTSGRGTCERTSRVAWTLAYGPIPLGLHVLHKCDVGRCVRPSHLFLGANLDNVRDKQAKGRDYDGVKYKPAKLSAHVAATIRRSKEKTAVLAKRYGVTQGHISEIQLGRTWLRLGVTPRAKRKHGTVKLTEADVIAIRASSAPGAELAKKYGVVRSHIYKVKRRLQWKSCGQ